MDVSGLNEQFFDEAGDLLADLETHLLALDPGQPDVEQLNAIFRAVHSIKGGAGALGFTAVQRTAHALENLLDAARRGTLDLRRELVDEFLEVKDTLATQLDTCRQGSEPDPTELERTCTHLNALAEREIGAAADVSGRGCAATSQAATTRCRDDLTVPAGTQPVAADSGRRLQVALLGVADADREPLVAELGRLGHVEHAAGDRTRYEVVLLSTETVEDIQAVLCFIAEPEQLAITELPPATPAVAADVATRETDGHAGTGDAPKVARGEPASLRVPVGKVDQIINLVGELIITQSMLGEAVAGLDPIARRHLAACMSLLERNTRDLQDAAMSVRMVPMERVFGRFPRIVRDLAGELGKQVELVMRGGATELDKSLTEKLIDPLTHLVRNAVDHGVEHPADREAAGKPRAGVLTLSAEHRGGSIVIEVSDDGAGLDREKILAKAQERGCSVADAAPDEQVWQLVFAPGFSTATQVSDVSGRGVGMDVVRRNIEAMGGHAEIHSESGRGSTTRIVLPLTLAILDGMVVRAGAETFIVPLAAVVESRQPLAPDLYTVAGGGRLLKVRDAYLPVVALREAMGVPGPGADATARIAVVVEDRSMRYALLVDELAGQQQVVVKNLETNYRRVRGVSGATVLGNGSVALILDVNDLSRCGRLQAASVDPGRVPGWKAAGGGEEHERVH